MMAPGLRRPVLVVLREPPVQPVLLAHVVAKLVLDRFEVRRHHQDDRVVSQVDVRRDRLAVVPAVLVVPQVPLERPRHGLVDDALAVDVLGVAVVHQDPELFALAGLEADPLDLAGRPTGHPAKTGRRPASRPGYRRACTSPSTRCGRRSARGSPARPATSGVPICTRRDDAEVRHAADRRQRQPDQRVPLQHQRLDFERPGSASGPRRAPGTRPASCRRPARARLPAATAARTAPAR